MVGVGAQDDLAYAKRFLDATRTTFTMLWSDSSEPWRHFGVTSNSTVMLLDRGGRVVEGSVGVFDPESLREQLDGLA